MNEAQTIQSSNGNLFDFNCFGIAIQVVTELISNAEAIEKQMTGLVVAQNPGLVGADGQPISRQAKRQIERKKGKM